MFRQRRVGLLCGFVLTLLPSDDRGKIGGGIGHLAPLLEDGHQGRVRAQSIEADPGLNRCASPGIVDQADGHFLLLLDLASEEIRHGREVRGGVGRAERPDLVGIFQVG